MRETVTLFLAGDVMTGRGLDQVLPYPVEPSLYEPGVWSACDYVTMAENANGAIPKPVAFEYPWGDALAELDKRNVAARIVNLETAITVQNTPAPKGINYRMNPKNIPVIAAAGLSCCVLANNHVLDWGRGGLLETLAALNDAGIRHAGAGRDLEQAAAPAAIPLSGGNRVLVFACGSETSGIPRDWGARRDRAGVHLLADLSPQAVQVIARQLRTVRRDGDVMIVSIHWGPNWGYGVSDMQRDFAHRLIEEGDVDIVHGHSSHHPIGIEVYKNRPILYGCGDFLNDYEGIGGYEAYHPELALMYLATIDTGARRLVRLEMIPFCVRNFRLGRASHADCTWLRDTLDREGRKLGTRVSLDAEDVLALGWA